MNSKSVQINPDETYYRKLELPATVVRTTNFLIKKSHLCGAHCI